jgi:hypothetical protein
MQPKEHSRSVMFRFLEILFEGHVLSAVDFFKAKNGPKCITHMAWGNAVRPFYSDSLHAARSAAYKVLQYFIRHSAQSAFPTARSLLSHNPQMPAENTPVSKVILITRRYGGKKARMLDSRTEQAIVQHFQERRFQAQVCCDFTVIRLII